jgi:hypothetical protein
MNRADNAALGRAHRCSTGIRAICALLAHPHIHREVDAAWVLAQFRKDIDDDR